MSNQLYYKQDYPTETNSLIVKFAVYIIEMDKIFLADIPEVRKSTENRDVHEKQ